MAIAEAAAVGVALSQYGAGDAAERRPGVKGASLSEALFGPPEAYWLGLLDAMTVTGVSR